MAKRRIGANRRLKIADRKRKKKPKKNGGFIGRILKVASFLFIASSVGILGFLGARKASGLIDTVDFLQVKMVEIRGVEHIDTTKVRSLAAIQPGISMLDLKTRDIQERIQKNPRVAQVKVRRKIPHTMVIAVTEREPVAFVNLGVIYMTDRKGFLWPLKSHTYWNLPIISGVADTLIDDTYHRLKKDAVEKMNRFFKDTERLDGRVPLRISQIDFSREDAVCIKIESSPLYALIKSSQVVEDLKHLQEILTTMDDNTDKMPSFVDLRYNNLAFVQ